MSNSIPRFVCVLCITSLLTRHEPVPYHIYGNVNVPHCKLFIYSSSGTLYLSWEEMASDVARRCCPWGYIRVARQLPQRKALIAYAYPANYRVDVYLRNIAGRPSDQRTEIAPYSFQCGLQVSLGDNASELLEP